MKHLELILAILVMLLTATCSPQLESDTSSEDDLQSDGDPARSAYNLTRENVLMGQSDPEVELVEQVGEDLPGPFKVGTGLTGTVGGGVEFRAYGASIDLDGEPGYYYYVQSYVQHDGDGWVIVSKIAGDSEINQD